MAQNVNVTIGGWGKTGVSISTPQYEVTIGVQWTDNAGAKRQHSERVLFPNILAQLPVEWVKEEMTDLLLRALRKRIGVDES